MRPAGPRSRWHFSKRNALTNCSPGNALTFFSHGNALTKGNALTNPVSRNQEQNYFRVKNNKKSPTKCICNCFVFVAQKLFSFDYPKFKFQIQSEANQCIKLFQIQNNNKSLHSFILTFCICRPKVIFILLLQL